MDRLAVVDIGSNSTRLLLCEGVGADGPTGERDTRITGLRRGAGVDGALAMDAIQRVADALVDYRGRIDAFGATRTVAVGTSAVRDAPNVGVVKSAVRGALGADLLVVDGETEADLAYLGARLAAPEGAAAVVDIGGGSTEVVRGDGPSRIGAVSLQLGAVRCTDGFLASDPPTDEELGRLRAVLADEMSEAARLVGGAEEHVIGVAGTFTTLAAVDIGHYDPALVHGHRIPTGRLREIAADLAEKPLAERRETPGLHPARAPYIVAGSEIGLAALDALSAPAVEVSERDILDGIALAALEPEASSLL